PRRTALPRRIPYVSAVLRRSGVAREAGHGVAIGSVTVVSDGRAGGGATPASASDPAVWPPAPLFRRFAALLVDWILCLLASGLFANPATSGWPPVAVLVLMYGFFVGLFGFTPGMYLTGLRCVSLESGRPVGIPR